MKSKILAVAALSMAALASGCNKEQTASQQIETVQARTADAAQSMKDYTFAQKAEFTADMQTQLAAINKDMDELAAKIEKSSDAIKAQAGPKLQALRDEVAQLNKQLDEARGAPESTWDSVKDGTRKSYATLKVEVLKARKWAADTIAP